MGKSAYSSPTAVQTSTCWLRLQQQQQHSPKRHWAAILRPHYLSRPFVCPSFSFGLIQNKMRKNNIEVNFAQNTRNRCANFQFRGPNAKITDFEQKLKNVAYLAYTWRFTSRPASSDALSGSSEDCIMVCVYYHQQ